MPLRIGDAGTVEFTFAARMRDQSAAAAAMRSRSRMSKRFCLSASEAPQAPPREASEDVAAIRARTC